MPKRPPSRRKPRPYREGRKPSPTAAPSGVFLPDKEMMVRLIAMKGATDSEIEEIFLCPKGSLTKWKKMYPSLAKALEAGRSVADADVLYATYRTAVGYDFHEEQAVGGKVPTKIEVRRHKPGEFPAQKYWLSNRMGWKNTERIEHTGAGGGPIGIKKETRDDIIDRLLARINPKPDNEATPQQDERK